MYRSCCESDWVLTVQSRISSNCAMHNVWSHWVFAPTHREFGLCRESQWQAVQTPMRKIGTIDRVPVLSWTLNGLILFRNYKGQNTTQPRNPSIAAGFAVWNGSGAVLGERPTPITTWVSNSSRRLVWQADLFPKFCGPSCLVRDLNWSRTDLETDLESLAVVFLLPSDGCEQCRNQVLLFSWCHVW